MSGHKVTVVGTGYVGMSMAVLLAQHNEVIALDIDAARVGLINQGKSTVADADIQEFLDDRELSFTATMDKKEAYEEAGVKGDILDDKIGEYSYKKWGATCRVCVYAMQVTEELPNNQWQESHRGRFWFSPEAAVKEIKQDEIKPLLLKIKNIVLKEKT